MRSRNYLWNQSASNRQRRRVDKLRIVICSDAQSSVGYRAVDQSLAEQQSVVPRSFGRACDLCGRIGTSRNK